MTRRRRRPSSRGSSIRGCGIAGFGSCQIYAPKKGAHICIDFHGRTPLAATPEMWADLLEGEARDGFGFVLRGNVNDLGYGSVTTPGALMAYAEAVDEFGSWDWQDVVAPAVAKSERGFAVRPHVHYWWTHGADTGRAEITERLGIPRRAGRSIPKPSKACMGGFVRGAHEIWMQVEADVEVP